MIPIITGDSQVHLEQVRKKQQETHEKGKQRGLALQDIKTHCKTSHTESRETNRIEEKPRKDPSAMEL